MCVVGLYLGSLLKTLFLNEQPNCFALLRLVSSNIVRTLYGQKMVFDSLDCKCYPLARKDDTIVEDFHGIKASHFHDAVILHYSMFDMMKWYLI